MARKRMGAEGDKYFNENVKRAEELGFDFAGNDFKHFNGQWQYAPATAAGSQSGWGRGLESRYVAFESFVDNADKSRAASIKRQALGGSRSVGQAFKTAAERRRARLSGSKLSASDTLGL